MIAFPFFIVAGAGRQGEEGEKKGKGGKNHDICQADRYNHFSSSGMLVKLFGGGKKKKREEVDRRRRISFLGRSPSSKKGERSEL